MLRHHPLPLSAWFATAVLVAGGCGSASSSAGDRTAAASKAPTAVGERDFSRPYVPDPSLRDAPPVDVSHHPTMLMWLQARVRAAYQGISENVRLPVIRRAADMDCDCPPNAIAPTTREGPFFWIRLDDRSGLGIPQREWLGWVEGRFKAETATYHTTDGGGIEMALTVFEVFDLSTRSPEDAPEARFVRSPF